MALLDEIRLIRLVCGDRREIESPEQSKHAEQSDFMQRKGQAIQGDKVVGENILCLSACIVYFGNVTSLYR